MKKLLIYISIVTLLVAMVSVYLVQNNSKTADIETVVDEKKTGTYFNSVASSSSIRQDQNVTKNNTDSYAYLLKSTRENMKSNVVGYFAHGAFAWYVPDWLINNWEMKPFRAEGMIFSPKIEPMITVGQQYDVSDIEFDVSTSTEVNNAYNLYLTMSGSIPKDKIIISEVLLNKSTMDMISIQMENSTRIYHITAYTGDFKRISDIYFMDGNGKTLDLRFETKADIFPQFSDKIRDMVEGIGELKLPQG